MLGGFALLAYPVEYGNSGIMTFMVSHDGTVFEKDLEGTKPAPSTKGRTTIRSYCHTAKSRAATLPEN